MTYTPETYNKASLVLAERKNLAELTAEKNYSRFIKKCPEASELESVLMQTGSRAAIAVVKGANARKELEQLKNINLALQEKLARLLKEHGFTTEDIEPVYMCKKCKDTGYEHGIMCSCYKDLLKKICFEELNVNTPLNMSGFDTFSVSYYKNLPDSQKMLMERIYAYCKSYANSFSLKSPSLLMQGATGLGKTHLSLAIAQELIEKGFGVIYGSVHGFCMSFEKERFNEESQSFIALCDCDLLIFDDLGTEFSSAYTLSVLYDIINTRIMRSLPTIISTNLTSEELEKRYSPRLISRFFGNYNKLGFVGQDVRHLKKFSKD